MTRRGFSLAELMLALVIAGFIGVSLTRLLINQSRFVDLQQSMMEARAGARAGFNVALSELRTVTTGGILTLSPDTIEARVPVAFGVACGQPSGGNQAVLLFPYDSAAYAGATIRGLGWQDSSGAWQFTSPVTLTGGSASDCTGITPPITVPPGWTVVRSSPNNTGTQAGAAVYFYQRVRYTFEPSLQVPGHRALWRNVIGSSTGAEELVAPFDTSTHFRFLTGNHLAVSTTPPAVLDSLRGIRMRLVGQSPGTPEGHGGPMTFTLQTDIVLVNRAR